MNIHWLSDCYRGITNAVFEAIDYRAIYNADGKSHYVKFDVWDGYENRKYTYGLLCSLDGNRMKIRDFTPEQTIGLDAEFSIYGMTFEEKVAVIGRACGL